MPFELSEETRRLLDFLSRQQAFSQQDPDPTAVLGDMQYIEGDKVINNGGAGQGYQIPIANGANTNAAWQEASQQPRVVTASRPATPEEYARVDHSPALEEIREQLRRQVEANFPAQTPPQQSSDEIVASAINQAFPQQQAQPTPQTQSASSQQAPAHQEQASGTDIVNRAVESAIPQSASRLLPPAPNTVQHYYRQQIIDNKLRYGEAELEYNAAQTPEAKQAALVKMQMYNQRANDLRGIANEAGVDLNGYGEGVALRDAQRNLESQRAKDFMQMYTGRYSMTSDQFWQSEYDRQIMRGASDYEARRSANRAAREYQASRVAYLNGMYNNYGLTNGQVTNQLGMQILAELAGEDPNRTNAYGTAYALPKDEYKNANEIAQLVLTNNNARENMMLQAKLNDRFADNNARRTRENYSYQKAVDDKYWEKQQRILAELKKEPNKIQQYIEEGKEYARLQGLEGEEAKRVVTDYVDFCIATNGGKSKGGNGGQPKEPKLTESQQKSFNTAENLFDNAHKSHSTEDIDAFENFVNEHGAEFNAAYYQRMKDSVLALKGFQYKLQNDDDNATALWSQVSDVNVLEQMYPNENWDYYWNLKGGKPK